MGLGTSIQKLITAIGIKGGYYIEIHKRTDKKILKNFIKLFFPVKTNKKLIRVGSKQDGGYVIPDDLEGIEALFSPGVGPTQDFDLACAEYGIKVFMTDASVDGPVINHKNFVFTKKFISALDTAEYMTIERWIKSSDLMNNSDLMLQMDIEGDEYETIYSIPKETMKRFRIIIIEFHNLGALLLNSFLFEKFKNSFLKILETHYVVHIHPNNDRKAIKFEDISIPMVMEFTFIRKDRVEHQGYVSEFPNQLDSDNNENKKTLTLPKCWYF